MGCFAPHTLRVRVINMFHVPEVGGNTNPHLRHKCLFWNVPRVLMFQVPKWRVLLRNTVPLGTQGIKIPMGKKIKIIDKEVEGSTAYYRLSR